MIHLLFGKDDYQVRLAAQAVRTSLAEGDDMLASNTTVLDGRGLAPDELLAHATAAPFLSANRLVIVEGLLRALGEVRGGRRGKRKTPAEDPLEPWRQAAARLADPATMPPTTTVIFIEGELTPKNPALPIFRPIAKTRELSPLQGGALLSWIRDEAKSLDVDIADAAVKALAESVGPDLWTAQNELRKLGVYAQGARVDRDTVLALVPAAEEARLWDLTDAIVARDERKALSSLRKLLTAGEAPQMLMFMVARQFRQLVQVKDLRDQRMGAGDIARITGIYPGRVDPVSGQAARYTWLSLRAAYIRLIEADLSVKRGLQDDESALQLLIHELCATAAGEGRPSRAPASPRR
ncbi:MAG: DNA polymerase III subunit delta [Chloroflexi bacterium]|nr:DNA polymerase III subunit delta [Chloroflexota bacterium]